MSRRGFTLIEVLGVIAVIGVLAAILFPIFARTRERARRSSCMANLFNMGLALRIYAHDYVGTFPPGLDGPERLAELGLVFKSTLTCPSSSIEAQFPAPASTGRPQSGPPASMGAGPPAAGQGMAAAPSQGGRRTSGETSSAAGSAATAGGPGKAPSQTSSAPPGPPQNYSPPPPSPPIPSYVYQPGLSFRRARHQLLIADAQARHDRRANVLFADGSLVCVPEVEWAHLLSPQLAKAIGWPEDEGRGPMAMGPGGGPPLPAPSGGGGAR